MQIRIKKGDIVIIILVFIIAAIAIFVAGRQKTGEYVIVTADGKKTRYPLSDNLTLQLETGNKGENTVVIYDHQVYMKEASCPDQICVHHRKISKNGESIICLPNEVYIEIESGNEKETDN